MKVEIKIYLKDELASEVIANFSDDVLTYPRQRDYQMELQIQNMLPLLVKNVIKFFDKTNAKS